MRVEYSKTFATLRQSHILHTTFTDLGMKYLAMCKVYTDVGGIKQLHRGITIICLIIIWTSQLYILCVALGMSQSGSFYRESLSQYWNQPKSYFIMYLCSLGLRSEMLKLRSNLRVFNISQITWRTFMHWKTMFDCHNWIHSMIHSAKFTTSKALFLSSFHSQLLSLIFVFRGQALVIYKNDKLS